MELDWQKYSKCFLKHKKGTDLYDSGGLLRCPKAHSGTYLVQKRFGTFILGSLILAKCLSVISLPVNWPKHSWTNNSPADDDTIQNV